ncbi:MAG: ribbon-helix-helix protein, CopG family [Halodesulfurarchaeum sp.]
MPRTFTIRCEDDLAAEIARLAREHDTSEEEVARQLLEVGLESVGA